jgi:hypothetical protein
MAKNYRPNSFIKTKNQRNRWLNDGGVGPVSLTWAVVVKKQASNQATKQASKQGILRISSMILFPVIKWKIKKYSF